MHDRDLPPQVDPASASGAPRSPSPSEERLRLALDAGGMALWEVDLVSGEVEHSPELNGLLGFPPEARPHLEDIRARYAPGERERLAAAFAAAAGRRERFLTSEIRFLHPELGLRWLAVRTQLHYDGGAPRRLVGVIFDVTARRRAEEEARRSQALNEAIVEAALDGIITIAADDRVVEWNHACEVTFGWPRDEALGRELTELIIPPEQHEAHRRGMARYLATGEGPLIGRRVEVEALRRDGRRFPVELALSPIRVGDSLLFTAYLRDLTERVTADAALRDVTQRLEATYENAFAGIGEVDNEGRFLRTNQQFSVITGFTREELLQRTVWDITHPDDAGPEREMFARHMAGELPVYSIEKRYVRKDGSIVWIELSASAVADEAGRPLYGVRVVRDITERRRWNEHQRLLINELNHRVKNTLATVQAMAAQTARLAGVADDPAAAYETFLERLMALSRAHDVLTRQSWEGAELSTMVQTAIQPFQGEAGERFRLSGPAAWLQPRAALGLAMALHELATNATKYGALSRPGGCVFLDWTVEPGGADPRLRLVWREEGGPPVTPPARKGFGSRLLERNLAAELEGRVTLDYRPDGLVCVMEARLPGRADESPNRKPVTPAGGL